jgi:sulfonate dioxygenase
MKKKCNTYLVNYRHIHATFGHPPNVPEAHVVYFDTETVKKYKSLGGVNFDLRSSADGWHSDVTYEKQPAGLTLLKIDTLPPTGGDTLWASGYSAYDRLSPAFQKFLEGLEAVHSGQQQIDEANRAGHVVRRKSWTATHPVVRTHPVTGWKALFVQPGFTRSIVGLSRRESTLILNYLFEHISGGTDFQVRFKWQENSVAVWDNRTTFHNAIFDYLEIGKRHGWRITPQAEAPYFDPKSKSRKEDLLAKAEAAAAKTN